MDRVPRRLVIALALACPGAAVGSPSSPTEVARNFLKAYLAQGPEVGEFEGVRRLAPFLSKRLLHVLDDAAECQRDWGRQQPEGSTDKPPFVDCCLFASSPEGIPTAFKLGPKRVLPDGRYEVLVEYTYADPPGTYSDPTVPLQTSEWRDALILTAVGGKYKIDDFRFLRDSSDASLLSNAFSGCRGRRWNDAPVK